MNGTSGIDTNGAGSRPGSEDKIMLAEGYRTYENYLERALAIYNRAKAYFHTLSANDRELLKAAERWKRAAVQLERWAGSFFNKRDGSSGDKIRAMELMDMISKDSAERSTNVSRYYDLLEEAEPDNAAALEEAEKADLTHLDVLRKMLNTQDSYAGRLESGDAGMTVERQAEREYSGKIRDTYSRIPGGHTYRPGYVYPPERIPEDEPVCAMPKVVEMVEKVPLSEKVYDEKLDEFVLKPGYVSEDGLIDADSLVYHPETEEVEFGFAGGKRTRWKYWKAGDDRDFPEPGSWVLDFYRRWYARFVMVRRWGLLERQPYEDGMPEYDVPPEGDPESDHGCREY